MLPSSTPAIFLLCLSAAASASPDPYNWWKEWSTYYPTDGARFEGGSSVAAGHAHNACYGWPGQRGYYQDMVFKSWASSPYTSALCVNTGGSHINFEIGNLSPTAGFTLSPKDCATQLTNIIFATNNGGEKQTAGWYFRADPNKGLC